MVRISVYLSTESWLYDPMILLNIEYVHLLSKNVNNRGVYIFPIDFIEPQGDPCVLGTLTP